MTSQRIMTKNRIKTVVFTLAGLLAAPLSTGCESRAQTHEEGAVFLTTSPVRTDTEATREYVCQIRAIQHIELRALESGYLENIYVDEGQVVKAGQRMFQILPTLYTAERHKAQAEATVAQIEYQNTKKLAAGPRVAWWHVKKNMKVAEEGSLSEALDSEAARMIRTGETEDHKEAARAFVEKRAPVFKGV